MKSLHVFRLNVGITGFCDFMGSTVKNVAVLLFTVSVANPSKSGPKLATWLLLGDYFPLYFQKTSSEGQKRRGLD